MRIYQLARNFYYALERKKRDKYLGDLVSKGLTLGQNVDIVADYFFDPSHCFLISIGDNTTIAPNVRLIAHDASTKKIVGYAKMGRIDIKENCFIGDSVIVLPGVKIGPNSIVGSGAVVTKNVPPNSIVAGNPAKVIASVDEYIKKIETMSDQKKVFGKEYYIENLDEKKRKEILDTIGNDIGFIV